VLKVLISASPENFSEPFVKMVKEAGFPVKLKVWSRDDHAKQGYDIYFLTQRDFVYLDKLHQLPPASKVIAIFSPSFKESFLIEETDVRFNGFIMGEVEERASRSVELLKIYFQHVLITICSSSKSLLYVIVPTMDPFGTFLIVVFLHPRPASLHRL
jgi:hypothetical protein